LGEGIDVKNASAGSADLPKAPVARTPREKMGTMKAGLILEARHYETYSLCSVVDSVIRNTSDHLRALERFHCDGQWAGWLPPLQKYSVLHRFIEFLVRQVHVEEADGVDLDERKRILKSF